MQIIQLESFDDVDSIGDKLSSVRADHVLLIVPHHNPPNLSRLNLTLLQRKTHQQGSSLGLVTDLNEIKAEAEEIGIQVFRSIPNERDGLWSGTINPSVNAHQRIPKRFLENTRAESSPAARMVGSQFWRWLLFIFGAASVFSLLIFLFPSAKVTIKPPATIQSLNVSFRSDPEIVSVSVFGDVPAIEKTVIVSGKVSGLSTKMISVPEQTAEGIVVLSNLTEAVVEVPGGTWFRTGGEDSVRFYTTHAIEVPAGIGQVVEVPVRAEMAGLRGNTPPDTLIAVEGTVGLLVTVSNPQAIRGGSDQRAKAPTEADYATLRRQLIKTLTQDAVSQFLTMAGDENLFLEPTLEQKDVLVETQIPAVGIPAETLVLEMQVEFKGLMVGLEDLEKIAQMELDTTLLDGYESPYHSIQFSKPEKFSLNSEGNTEWEMKVSRKIIPKINRTELARRISGRTPVEVKQILAEDFNLDQPAMVEFWPKFWFTMPYFPNRIEVIVS